VYVYPAGAAHVVAVTVTSSIVNVPFPLSIIGVHCGFVTNPLLTVPYVVLFDAILTSYSFLSQTAYKTTSSRLVLDNPLTVCLSVYSLVFDHEFLDHPVNIYELFSKAF
jgi:hypothetical protein